MSKKEEISIVVVGHVDSGKSTTCGQLMVSLNAISPRVIEQYQKESNEMGKGSFSLAWCMDGLKAERERGITINSSLNVFETPNKKVTIIDAPGHRDFIKNMITGTSQADSAVLIVSAAKGEFESGVSENGQTREHALLAHTLGIKSFVVAVNKMDTHKFSKERFNEIKTYIEDYLIKLGYPKTAIAFVPISGFNGDNVLNPSDKLSWFTGPTLVTAIDKLEIPRRSKKKPLRVPIQSKYKIPGIGIVASGRVETGILKAGLMGKFQPGNFTSEIKSVQMNRSPVDAGLPGMNVGFNFKGIPFSSVKRGMVLGDSKRNPPRIVKSFKAKTIILKHNNNIKCGYSPVVHVHTASVTCKLVSMAESFDRRNHKKLEEKPKFLKQDQGAILEFVPEKKLVLETFKKFSPLGRFSIRDSKQTVGAGIVVEIEFEEDEDEKKQSKAKAKN